MSIPVQRLHIPYTVSTADAVSEAISLVALQTYSAVSTGWDWRIVRLLHLVLESRILSEIVILISSEDSWVRLLLDSRLHHVITGVTPSASQVNTAGLGDTTVVFMGGTVMVAGTEVGKEVGTDMEVCFLGINFWGHENLIMLQHWTTNVKVQTTTMHIKTYFAQPAQTHCYH